MRLEVCAESCHLGPAAQLLALERPNAHALDSDGVHERQRPYSEVQLRVEDAEERRAHEAYAIRKVQAKLREMHRYGAVEEAEQAADSRGNGHPGHQPLYRA